MGPEGVPTEDNVNLGKPDWMSSKEKVASPGGRQLWPGTCRSSICSLVSRSTATIQWEYYKPDQDKYWGLFRLRLIRLFIISIFGLGLLLSDGVWVNSLDCKQ